MKTKTEPAKLALLLALVIAFQNVGPIYADDADFPKPVLLAAVRSVVLLRVEEQLQGSGVLVADNQIMTVDHGVDKFQGQRVRIEDMDVRIGGKKIAHGPKVMRQNALCDMALLEIPANQHTNRELVPLAPQSEFGAKPGAIFYAVGIESGISRLKVTYVEDGVPIFLGESVDQGKGIEEGDSGGAILDEQGNLVGMIRSMVRWDGRVIVGAVRSDYLNKMMKGDRTPTELPEPQASFAADLLLGNMAIISGQNKKAVDFLLKAIQIQPQSAFAHAELGDVYETAGQSEKAKGEMQEARRLAPNSPDAYSGLAQVEYALNDFENAAKDYQRAVELTPKFADAQYDMAATLENMGQYARAEQEYRKALQLADTDNEIYSQSYRGIAFCLAKQGKYREAWKAVAEWRHAGWTPDTKLINWLKQKMPEPAA